MGVVSGISRARVATALKLIAEVLGSSVFHRRTEPPKDAGDGGGDLQPWNPGQERHFCGPDVGRAQGCDSLECSLAFRGFLSARSVESDGRADERLECIRVNLLTLVNVDGAPYVPVKARVEELGRIFQGSALKEGSVEFQVGCRA